MGGGCRERAIRNIRHLAHILERYSSVALRLMLRGPAKKELGERTATESRDPAETTLVGDIAQWTSPECRAATRAAVGAIHGDAERD